MVDSASQALRLESAVAEYLGGVDLGLAPDRGELLARYGDVATDLNLFFNDHDRMLALATPLRGAIVASLEEWQGLTAETSTAQIIDEATITLDSAGRPMEPAIARRIAAQAHRRL